MQDIILQRISYLCLLVAMPLSVFLKQGLTAPFMLLGLCGAKAAICNMDICKAKTLMALGSIAILGILCGMLKVSPPSTLVAAVKFLLFILVAYCVFSQLSTLPKALHVFIYSVFVATLLCCVDSIYGFSSSRIYEKKLHWLKHKDHFSINALVAAFVLLAAMKSHAKPYYKGLAGLSLALCILCILFLTNNTAIYCLFIGFAVVAISFGINWKLLQRLTACCVVITVLIMPWALNKVITFETSAHNELLHKGSFFHRQVIWQFIANSIIESPGKIRGFDSLRVANPREKEARWNQAKALILNDPAIQKSNKFSVPLHPHNISLQIWYEFGALGGLMLSMLMVMFLFSIRFPHNRFLQSSAYGLFCSGFIFFHVSYGLWESKRWMIIVIAFSMLVNMYSSSTFYRNKDYLNIV